MTSEQQNAIARKTMEEIYKAAAKRRQYDLKKEASLAQLQSGNERRHRPVFITPVSAKWEDKPC